jgi:hypothetical protein
MKKFILSTLSFIAIIAFFGYTPSVGIGVQLGKFMIFLTIFICFVYFIINLVRFSVSKYKDIKPSKIIFLQPVIIIPLSIVSILYLKSIDQRAIDYLWKTAEAVNTICSSKGICPEQIDGFFPKGDTRQYQKYYVGSTLFHLYYISKDNTFKIYINYGPDLGYHLKGGANLEVSRV